MPNITEVHVDIARDMFVQHTFSDGSGVIDTKVTTTCNELTHVVSVRPWHLSIMEKIDGAWCRIFLRSFARKADAIEAAIAMGAEPDYVSHHADSIESTWLGDP